MNNEIKIGDKFIDKWGNEDICMGFGGNLAHSGVRDDGYRTNDYGIKSKYDLIKMRNGDCINIGNIEKIIN